MVENLPLLFQDVNTVHIDRFGSLRDWIHEALGCTLLFVLLLRLDLDRYSNLRIMRNMAYY
jgi:hypothetical protein